MAAKKPKIDKGWWSEFDGACPDDTKIWLLLADGQEVLATWKSSTEKWEFHALVTGRWEIVGWMTVASYKSYSDERKRAELEQAQAGEQLTLLRSIDANLRALVGALTAPIDAAVPVKEAKKVQSLKEPTPVEAKPTLPRLVSDEEIRALSAQGVSIRQIAVQLGVSRHRVDRALGKGE